MNLLGHRILHRPGTGSGAATCTERTSADFLIDGQSLLEMLVKNAGGHSDFMGCFGVGMQRHASVFARRCSTLRLRTESVCCFTSAQSAAMLAAAHIRPSCGAIANPTSGKILPTRWANMIRRHWRQLDRLFSNQIYIKPACSLRRDFDGPEQV
jgi:hypothetical protein